MTKTTSATETGSANGELLWVYDRASTTNDDGNYNDQSSMFNADTSLIVTQWVRDDLYVCLFIYLSETPPPCPIHAQSITTLKNIPAKHRHKRTSTHPYSVPHTPRSFTDILEQANTIFLANIICGFIERWRCSFFQFLWFSMELSFQLAIIGL